MDSFSDFELIYREKYVRVARQRALKVRGQFGHQVTRPHTAIFQRIFTSVDSTLGAATGTAKVASRCRVSPISMFRRSISNMRYGPKYRVVEVRLPPSPAIPRA